MKRIMAAWLCLGLAGCAPTAVVRNSHALSPTPAQESFVVIKENEPFSAAADEVGDIHIRDSGLTLQCDYETVVALATDRARQLGANLLRIYEHRQPSVFGSSCHQIRAKALRVADITPFEKEVIWQPTRRLKQADFKASTDNRPFQAATASSIRYRYSGQGLGKVRLVVETYFDCQSSYFKPSPHNEHTLAHEQLHFDITEIYARRLTKALQEQVANSRELEQKHEAIFKQVFRECQTLQDEYDSEVYQDRSKLPQWQQRIAQNLTALQPYASKSLTINMTL